MRQVNRIESWRPVVDWEDLYQVSDIGRVRSLDRVQVDAIGRTRRYQGKILAQGHDSRYGHLVVTLSRPGKRRTYTVHSLVIEAFDRPRRPGEECRHGPGGKTDNRWPENLCYGSYADNRADMLRDGTIPKGERKPGAKLTDTIVLECRQRYAEGELGMALAAEYEVGLPTMFKAITGETWKHLPGAVPEAKRRWAVSSAGS